MDPGQQSVVGYSGPFLLSVVVSSNLLQLGLNSATSEQSLLQDEQFLHLY